MRQLERFLRHGPAQEDRRPFSVSGCPPAFCTILQERDPTANPACERVPGRGSGGGRTTPGKAAAPPPPATPSAAGCSRSGRRRRTKEKQRAAGPEAAAVASQSSSEFPN